MTRRVSDIYYMTRFIDGPAKGVTLMLRRAPLYLRVTIRPMPGAGDKLPWDALDQPEDTPTPDETLVAYIRQGPASGAFIDGPRVAGFYTLADYVMVPEQPTDAQMRDNAAWREWCLAAVKQNPPKEV